jgi:hypothetical protein
VEQCLNCCRAGEGQDADGNPWPVHCKDCPCCRACEAHQAAGCPLCNPDVTIG